MQPLFPLSPRYRLDDELPWLVGIDPARRYWLAVNGEQEQTMVIPGLLPHSRDEFKAAILAFRGLQPGETLTLNTLNQPLHLHCVADNCYAIATEVKAAPVWHLFDYESIESLLMTAHPDWQCAPQHLALGRSLLSQAFEQSVAA